MENKKKYLDRETALSFPLANGKYDKKNANEDFIFGYESYKEYLETLEPLSTDDILKLNEDFEKRFTNLVQNNEGFCDHCKIKIMKLFSEAKSKG